MRRLPSPYGDPQTPYPPPIFGSIPITQVPLIGPGGWYDTTAHTNNPVVGEPAMPQKPDSVTAKSADKPFPIHPVGQFAARCVDVIDLGEAVSEYAGQPPYLAQKVALAFWTGEVDPEADKVVTIVMEFTLSMGKKANMRAFLESWRGQSYTDEQAKQGVPIDKLYGAPALISVEHKTSNAGKAYARIKSIAPLPKQMASAVPPVDQIDYTRDEWWAKKKEQYAKDAAEFKAKSRPKASAAVNADFSDFPEAVADEDELPFD